MDIGVYFQCYKQPYATYMALKSFRKYYPTNTIVLVSDNGYDYTNMAEYFSCKYIHRTINTHLIYENIEEIDKGKEGAHVVWAKRLCDNLADAFTMIKEDYILWMEDDVIVNGQLQESLLYSLNGYNPNNFWKIALEALHETYSHIDPSIPYTWTGGGGSVFHKSHIISYLQDKDCINDLVSNWRTYHLTSNIVCDFFLSLLIHCKNGTIGRLMCTCDGPRNTPIPSIIFQHQYKRWYGVPLPDDLVHLVTE